MKTRIEARIEELQKDIIEESEEGIDKGSLVDFFNFLELIDDVVAEELSITVTPDNKVYANWKPDKKYCLCFKGNGIIKFFAMKEKE